MDLSKQFDTVLFLYSSPDPAVDVDRLGEKLGERTRVESFFALREAESLPFKDGVQPVRFTLRPIGAQEINALVTITDPEKTDPAELWTVVQRCLIAVKGDPSFALNDEDFAVIDAARGTKMLKAEAMARLAAQYGINGVRELGRAVIQRATPPARALAPFALPRG